MDAQSSQKRWAVPRKNTNGSRLIARYFRATSSGRRPRLKAAIRFHTGRSHLGRDEARRDARDIAGLLSVSCDEEVPMPSILAAATLCASNTRGARESSDSLLSVGTGT